MAARRNSCGRPSKTQVSEKAQFAAGERDAATRIFISTKTPTGGAMHPCPANPANLKIRILSQLFTLRNFLRTTTTRLAALRVLQTTQQAQGIFSTLIEGQLGNPFIFQGFVQPCHYFQIAIDNA